MASGDLSREHGSDIAQVWCVRVLHQSPVKNLELVGVFHETVVTTWWFGQAWFRPVKTVWDVLFVCVFYDAVTAQTRGRYIHSGVKLSLRDWWTYVITYCYKVARMRRRWSSAE